LHARPRVQRASGISCSLQFEGHETQTSGVSRRENVDVYLLFEIRIETPFRHCEQAARHNETVIARRGGNWRMVHRMTIHGPVVTAAITPDVIAGLDPAIHHFRNVLIEDRWIRGSSPRMTLGGRREEYAS
jgi:hypothetical protein